MSIIPRSKWGNCTCGCGQRDVACVKVGKDLISYECNKRNKANNQIQKANLRNSVRSLPHIKGEEKDAISSRNAILQDLDYTFSRYIRILYSNDAGMCQCYTCSTERHWTLMQNGHFVSRKHVGLRYDIRNGKPQCEYCNCHLHGNLEVYAANLELEDAGLPERLFEQSREVEKPSTDELKMLLVDLRAKLKMVELKLKK